MDSSKNYSWNEICPVLAKVSEMQATTDTIEGPFGLKHLLKLKT